MNEVIDTTATIDTLTTAKVETYLAIAAGAGEPLFEEALEAAASEGGASFVAERLGEEVLAADDEHEVEAVAAELARLAGAADLAGVVEGSLVVDKIATAFRA